VRKRVVIACIFFLISGFVANAFCKSFNGDAVAFSGAETALNGIVWADVLIVKSKGVKSPQELVIVQLSVPESEWDHWLSEISSVHNFRVRRAKIKEEELVEHEHFIDKESGAKIGEYPVWHMLTGNEMMKIPFGKRIPVYDSLDWPVRPVL